MIAPTALLNLTGPMPASFKISSFPAPATTSTTPTRRVVTLDELRKLLGTHDRRLNKDGRGWSGATYKSGTTRANKNVVEWSVYVADLDHIMGDDWLEIRATLVRLGLAFILYSTYNSTETDYRLRVVVPFTKPIPAAQYGTVWRQVDAAVFAGRNDPQTKDASRMSYLPAAPEGVATVAEYVPGLALDWEKLPEAPAWLEPATGSTSAGQDVGVSRDVLLFTIDGAPVGRQRGMALRAGRSFLSAGKDIDETADLVWRGLQVSPVGDAADPWTYEQAREIVEDIAKREAPPLEKRPELEIIGRIDSSALKRDHADGRNGAAGAAPSSEGIGGSPAPDERGTIHSSATTTLVADGRISPFRTARELAADAPPKPGWIVEGYVAEGAITELDGKLKSSGKTTWLMGMMGKAVEGEPFMGRPTSQTGFVVLSEQNATSMLAALRRGRLDERDDIVILLWSSARGIPWPILVKMAAEEARRRGYRVVIVDTLPQFAGISGDGENSSGAALETMGPIQQEAASGLAFIVSRHERKSGGDVGDSARGSSAFSGAVDIVLSLRRPEGQHRDTVRVIQALSRFDETPTELMIELEGGEYIALGTSEEVRAAAARRSVLDELPVTAEDAIEAKAIVEALQDAKIKRTTVYKLLIELTECGEVSALGAGKRGDPFRYWRSRQIDPSAPPVVADESIESASDIIDEAIDRDARERA